jgi:hypothetical protein
MKSTEIGQSNNVQIFLKLFDIDLDQVLSVDGVLSLSAFPDPQKLAGSTGAGDLS